MIAHRTQAKAEQLLDRLMGSGFIPAGHFPAYFSKVRSYRRQPDNPSSRDVRPSHL